MAESKREQIIAALETILESITTDNGYNYDFGSGTVERFSMYGPASVDLPRIIISCGPNKPSPLPDAHIECLLTVYLAVYMTHKESDTVPTDKHLSRLEADVMKAVLSNDTLSGTAIDCNIVDVDPFANTEGQRYFGIVVEVQIKYRQKRTDPTQ